MNLQWEVDCLDNNNVIVMERWEMIVRNMAG